MKFEGTENISQEFVHDVYKNKKLGLMDHWQEKANVITNEVYESFQDAQKKGWIRKDMNIQFLMAFNAKMVDMIDDPALLQIAGGTQKLVMELTNLFFYGIFPQHEQ